MATGDNAVSAAALRAALAAAGLKQIGLARLLVPRADGEGKADWGKRVDLKRQEINKMAAGGRSISQSYAEQIAAVLPGVKADDLVTPKPTKPADRDPLGDIDKRLKQIEADQRIMVKALGLDEDTPPNLAQALATVAALEQQILRLLAELGWPDANQWLNGQR